MMLASRRQGSPCSEIMTRSGIGRGRLAPASHRASLPVWCVVSAPLKDNPPWYLRPFRTGRELPLFEQAMLPMQSDWLPSFHAQFGEDHAALQTGDGHFLLWITLPEAGPTPSEFVRSVAQPWEVFETRLDWRMLLPSSASAQCSAEISQTPSGKKVMMFLFPQPSRGGVIHRYCCSFLDRDGGLAFIVGQPCPAQSLHIARKARS